MQGAIPTFNRNYEPFQEKDNKNDILSRIDKYDATMLSYLARLYEGMTGEKMDLNKIKSAVDALATYNKKAEYNYLNDLLYPEKCKGVKIPSPIPVPSCSFQLHNCVTLSTNAAGNLAFIFNPFFLGNSNDLTYANPAALGNNTIPGVNYFSTLFVNNSVTLSGTASDDNFYPVNIGQTIPNVYDQYRLVSASVVVRYIGRMDITSGVIGGAIIFDDSKMIGTSSIVSENGGGNINVPNANHHLAKFGNFDLAMDSFYHQENMVLEGIRELYFPIDNSYEEYTKTLGISQTSLEIYDAATNSFAFKVEDVDNYKSGFNYFVYVLGAPATTACFKVDIYCNFECLPNSSFLNYLPLSMNAGTISNAEKKSAISIIQEKPILTVKDNAVVPRKPSIWEKLKKKFSNSLPSIEKLISWGIGSMIPSLKPGLALAGTMIGMNNDQMIEEDVE